MRLVTLSELRTRALRRAKMENSQFASADEVDRLVREGVAELYDKLISARGAKYYMVAAEVMTVPGLVLYTLPENFYRLLAVHATDDPTAHVMAETPDIAANPEFAGTFAMILNGSESPHAGWRQLDPFMDQETAAWLNAGSGPPATYRLRGYGQFPSVDADTVFDVLEIRPIPSAASIVRVEYVPTAWTESISVDVDAPKDPKINGINGWEQWVVLRVARTLLEEEESDTSGISREMAELDQRIQALADNRDSGRPERVQDVMGEVDDFGALGIPARSWWWG